MLQAESVQFIICCMAPLICVCNEPRAILDAITCYRSNDMLRNIIFRYLFHCDMKSMNKIPWWLAIYREHFFFLEIWNIMESFVTLLYTFKNSKCYVPSDSYSRHFDKSSISAAWCIDTHFVRQTHRSLLRDLFFLIFFFLFERLNEYCWLRTLH